MKRILFFQIIFTQTLVAQIDSTYINWYNGSKPGMWTEQAYKRVKRKKAHPVVVAVLDSGVDIEHEDLAGHIWVNEDEVPNNGIDDDKNGFVDDINGWNFLGNSKGENVTISRLEKARFYAILESRYNDLSETNLSASERENYRLYQKIKTDLETEQGVYKEYLQQLEEVRLLMVSCPKLIAKALKKEKYTLEEVTQLITEDAELYQAKKIVEGMLSGELTYALLEEQEKELQSKLDLTLNPAFNERELIGDNPTDFNDRSYGNNNVEGPDALHGTHVAGIIAGQRGNHKGGDGVASSAIIMSVRVVPDGDEHDKDVALGIRYAVDNGAKIINMSFGKDYSPYQEDVYAALLYAYEKDVLIVHAAGNDGRNIEVEQNYPSCLYDFQKEKLPNFLTVGASTPISKGNLVAYFSNYGSQFVDIFAPGTDIFSAIPNNRYAFLQGTSMAAPMVSGAAAFLKGYFPELSMVQIAAILCDTGTEYSHTKQVNPSSGEDQLFSEMCRSGRVVNLFRGLKLAKKSAKNK